MPFVRIDLSDQFSPQQASAMADAVHDSLVRVFKVPRDDRFQVIRRCAAHELVCSAEYLGLKHSSSIVFVQIDCSPGRTVGTKEALYALLAKSVAEAGGCRADDVIVHLAETLRENWSFGAGIAHYAVVDRTQPALEL